MTSIHKAMTVLMIALGLTHVAFTFRDHELFSIDALWFASAGVAIVLAGFVNAAEIRTKGRDVVIWILCILTNLLFAAMFGAAVYLLPQPPVYFGLVLFALALICSLFSRRSTSGRNGGAWWV